MTIVSIIIFVYIICLIKKTLMKKPARGGIPINENKVMAINMFTLLSILFRYIR